MVARKKYKERVSISLNTDREIFNQYMELVRKQGLSVSESLTALMKESIQKNQVWAASNNPIKITYSNDINQPGKKDDITSLDYFIENKRVTSDYWHNCFSKVDSSDQIARYEALSLTIHNQAKQRKHFLKTGKYLVQ